MSDIKDILIPPLGDSLSEATIGRWLKAEGSLVTEDEPVVEVETDKVTLEVGAPATGVLTKAIAQVGETVQVGAVVGQVTKGEVAQTSSPSTPLLEKPEPKKPVHEPKSSAESLKEDKPEDARIRRVPLSRLRQRIAERLKEAQNTAAILTTFNEVDMSRVMTLRQELKDTFQSTHGVKLGFMSFFVKACVNGLKEIPAINGEIKGGDILYKDFYDIGVAVGTPQGLVVPVVRDADAKNLAEIEKDIAALGQKARDGKLSLEELMGGTFTISNGGVYGSLLSTPILNPPQSGILGMHKIQERPVVVDGKIEIRPMMYLALSYDHRLVDGQEAVTFLVRVKEALENPDRLLSDE